MRSDTIAAVLMSSLRRSARARWALWVFAAALLLKGAMPWLASASAELQGKTLVEVCTAYGVSLVSAGGERHDDGSSSAADHAKDVCALSGLTVLAAHQPAAIAEPDAVAVARRVPLAHPSPQAPDACATWVARLKHGPPALS